MPLPEAFRRRRERITVFQIKQYGGRYDGYFCYAYVKADPLPLQIFHHAGSRIQPECRASGKYDRLYALHCVERVQQVGFTRARRRTPYVYAADRAFFRDDNGNAGFCRCVFRLPDFQALYIQNISFHVFPS